MSFNNYQYREPESKVFEIADGKHQAIIKDAKQAKSKDGKDMITVTLDVYGSNGIDYLHFICDGEYFDQSLSRFCDCFGLVMAGSCNNYPYKNWIGKSGKVITEHRKEEYKDKNGNTKEANRARIKFFVSAKEKEEAQTNTSSENQNTNVDLNKGEFPEDVLF